VHRIYPISSGKPSTPTILGRFRVYLKVPGYLPDGMYFSNFFYRGYAGRSGGHARGNPPLLVLGGARELVHHDKGKRRHHESAADQRDQDQRAMKAAGIGHRRH
jgi:hypothetical protein